VAQRNGFILSLITRESDYQVEEAAEAERVARQFGVELNVLYADNDAVTQSQQLLDKICGHDADQSAGIIVQPVGTSLRQVAHAASSAGIGWVVLNRDADYLAELRRTSKAPAFEVTMDHVEIGRIQGRQMAALLPEGGMALYLEGPSTNPTALQRKAGMLETKPANIQLRTIRSQWGKHHAATAVASWLCLSTSHQIRFGLVAAQSDTLAMGAREAIESELSVSERDQWLALPFLGCDGCVNTGRKWTDEHLLTATVRVPLLSGTAINLLLKALTGKPVEPRTLIMPEPYPAIAELRERRPTAGSPR
jgi:ribose transport system substrate-binding protein